MLGLAFLDLVFSVLLPLFTVALYVRGPRVVPQVDAAGALTAEAVAATVPTSELSNVDSAKRTEEPKGKKIKRKKKGKGKHRRTEVVAPEAAPSPVAAMSGDEESVEEFEEEEEEEEEVPQRTNVKAVVSDDEESVEEFEIESSEEEKGEKPYEDAKQTGTGDDEESVEEFESSDASERVDPIDGFESDPRIPNAHQLKLSKPTIVVAYASNSRTALAMAHRLFNSLQTALHDTKHEGQNTSSGMVVPDVKVLEVSEEAAVGFSSTILFEEKFAVLTVFIVSTFTGGRAPPASQNFEMLLEDAYKDHRVPRDLLAKKRFALFGLGDPAYGKEEFNRFGKQLYTWCRGLGAPRFVLPPVYATERRAEALFKNFTVSLVLWVGKASFTAEGGVNVTRGRGSKNRKDEKAQETDPAGVDCSDEEGVEEGGEELEDMEDAVWDGNDVEDDPENPPELLYPRLRENLSKQGYQLIGSHSGVKLCRWTKSMLRGRGGCYKHTFYNIDSSQCMEMTPSLACANKCIFCWRHHTNPVSRHFRWKQDPPEFLIQNGMEQHYKMIKQMKGVPGVTPERLEAAMTIRHCALSLVGEPIMYPQINEFCSLLHQRHISSFMVTNAQFPEQLRQLQPVVQLYLSIDAANPEELKRIDRPLFEDYWERCLQCVQELRHKKQRTVFRLTLVNQYNAENITGYADLVDQAMPDFIEVKGVTYCGTSNSSTLTMKDNVPRHDEVIRFCTDLCAELARRRPDYQTPHMNGRDNLVPAEEQNRPYHIACEHEHSCCVLIALDKFFVDGRWHTWIDYPKFFALVESGRTDFTSLDYAAETPSWAVYRSPEAGFDPLHIRVTKTGKPRPTAPSADADADS